MVGRMGDPASDGDLTFQLNPAALEGSFLLNEHSYDDYLDDVLNGQDVSFAIQPIARSTPALRKFVSTKLPAFSLARNRTQALSTLNINATPESARTPPVDGNVAILRNEQSELPPDAAMKSGRVTEKENASIPQQQLAFTAIPQPRPQRLPDNGPTISAKLPHKSVATSHSRNPSASGIPVATGAAKSVSAARLANAFSAFDSLSAESPRPKRKHPESSRLPVPSAPRIITLPHRTESLTTITPKAPTESSGRVSVAETSETPIPLSAPATNDEASAAAAIHSELPPSSPPLVAEPNNTDEDEYADLYLPSEPVDTAKDVFLGLGWESDSPSLRRDQLDPMENQHTSLGPPLSDGMGQSRPTPPVGIGPQRTSIPLTPPTPSSPHERTPRRQSNVYEAEPRPQTEALESNELLVPEPSAPLTPSPMRRVGAVPALGWTLSPTVPGPPTVSLAELDTQELTILGDRGPVRYTTPPPPLPSLQAPVYGEVVDHAEIGSQAVVSVSNDGYPFQNPIHDAMTKTEFSASQLLLPKSPEGAIKKKASSKSLRTSKSAPKWVIPIGDSSKVALPPDSEGSMARPAQSRITQLGFRSASHEHSVSVKLKGKDKEVVGPSLPSRTTSNPLNPHLSDVLVAGHSRRGAESNTDHPIGQQSRPEALIKAPSPALHNAKGSSSYDDSATRVAHEGDAHDLDTFQSEWCSHPHDDAHIPDKVSEAESSGSGNHGKEIAVSWYLPSLIIAPDALEVREGFKGPKDGVQVMGSRMQEQSRNGAPGLAFRRGVAKPSSSRLSHQELIKNPKDHNGDSRNIPRSGTKGMETDAKAAQVPERAPTSFKQKQTVRSTSLTRPTLTSSSRPVSYSDLRTELNARQIRRKESVRAEPPRRPERVVTHATENVRDRQRRKKRVPVPVPAEVRAELLQSVVKFSQVDGNGSRGRTTIDISPSDNESCDLHLGPVEDSEPETPRMTQTIDRETPHEMDAVDKSGDESAAEDVGTSAHRVGATIRLKEAPLRSLLEQESQLSSDSGEELQNLEVADMECRHADSEDAPHSSSTPSGNSGNKRPSLESPIRNRISLTKKTRVDRLPWHDQVERCHSGTSTASAIIIQDDTDVDGNEAPVQSVSPISPLHVLKRGQKRTSAGSEDDLGLHKRPRLLPDNPRRIVSHDAVFAGPSSKGPPRGPAHRPLAMPFSAPIPGEASRQRALERLKRNEERDKRQGDERHPHPRERVVNSSQQKAISDPIFGAKKTIVQPFNFTLDARAAQHRAQFQERLAQWEQRSREAMEAAEAAKRFVLPNYATRQAEHFARIQAARKAAKSKVTRPKTPGLRTKMRVIERHAFDEVIRAKEKATIALREAKRLEQEEQERREVKLLRKQLDQNVKAHPIPYWNRIDDEIEILENGK
ncbi:uncharacterized protein EI90DRAFT_3011365 [Cantharellus anzutake]|uniref:uncharacterized protein n=1 Tax=Cantharellus anzutake TaxID=1750568 RepID=UPI001908CFB4|nr:uncharacterized protein EI90DRAFT_3011365 [Cantharellus anzutake]KAF8342934.1 hypothetical protein EI90DRAFT_3011365 [Cantharellus anzutake]